MDKKIIKIALDIVMTILFVLLMEVPATGMFWHELLGLVIFGLFAVHKLLNLNWIKGVTLAFLTAKCKAVTRTMYVLDALLVVLIGGTAISGILISQSLLPFMASGNTALWFGLHSSFAYGSMILISVHLGMHWKSIMAAACKMFSLRYESRPRTLALRIIAAILVAIGIKNSINYDLGGKLFAPLALTPGKSGFTASDDVKETEMISSGKLSSSVTPVATSTASKTSSMSLSEYLGSLVCTACPKHCSLLSPQCGKGAIQAQQAKQKYNSSIKSSSSSKNEDVKSEAGDYKTATAIVYVYDVNNVLDAFADIIPMMTIYVAGTYYVLKFGENKQKQL